MWFLIAFFTIIVCVGVVVVADLHGRVRDLEETIFFLQRNITPKALYDGVRSELESLSGSVGSLGARVDTLEGASRKKSAKAKEDVKVEV
jgi:hypothetical protein